MLKTDLPYMGVSLDGFVTDDCCGGDILEFSAKGGRVSGVQLPIISYCWMPILCTITNSRDRCMYVKCSMQI